jgi:hypothetical protein
MGSRTGRFVHASFHESDEHWLVPFLDNGKKTNLHQWRRPPESAPGLTHCVEILSAPVVAEGEPSLRKGVEWYRPSGPDARIHFDIFLEAPGTRPDSWPGRTSTGTTLLGRVAMAGGGTACVVVCETADDLSIRLPDAAQDAFGRAATLDDPWIFFVLGSDADGHVIVLDMPVDRDKAAAIARGDI